MIGKRRTFSNGKSGRTKAFSPIVSFIASIAIFKRMKREACGKSTRTFYKSFAAVYDDVRQFPGINWLVHQQCEAECVLVILSHDIDQKRITSLGQGEVYWKGQFFIEYQASPGASHLRSTHKWRHERREKCSMRI